MYNLLSRLELTIAHTPSTPHDYYHCRLQYKFGTCKVNWQLLPKLSLSMQCHGKAAHVITIGVAGKNIQFVVLVTLIKCPEKQRSQRLVIYDTYHSLFCSININKNYSITFRSKDLLQLAKLKLITRLEHSCIEYCFLKWLERITYHFVAQYRQLL